jgi:biopolymer transport protein TolQ
MMTIPTATPFGDIGRSFFSLVIESGPFAKVIIVILVVISVVSWAIMIDRSRLYRRLRKGGRVLENAISSRGLDMPFEVVQRCMPSVEGALLMETKTFVEGARRSRAMNKDEAINQLRGLLERRAAAEISEMERNLVFLATTTTLSPFLGLLGTVWGIMDSFLSMGVEGTASIHVVGPGVAEALVTTIGGLGAAITALVGYNLLARHVRRQETRTDLFISRILGLAGAEVSVAERPMTQSEALYEKKSL